MSLFKKYEREKKKWRKWKEQDESMLIWHYTVMLGFCINISQINKLILAVDEFFSV